MELKEVYDLNRVFSPPGVLRLCFNKCCPSSRIIQQTGQRWGSNAWDRGGEGLRDGSQGEGLAALDLVERWGRAGADRPVGGSACRRREGPEAPCRRSLGLREEMETRW